MSGEESRTKGKLFEQQVAKFLEKQGWQPTLGQHFHGKIAVRKHDCDVFATKTSVGWSLLAIGCFLLGGVGIASWSGLFATDTASLALPSLLVGLFAASKSTRYVWIECKTLQQSIKRDLIMKLKDQFRDAKKAVGSWECWLVSTSRFDEDAIAHAKEHGVVCYQAVDAGGRSMALHRVDSTTGDV